MAHADVSYMHNDSYIIYRWRGGQMRGRNAITKQCSVIPQEGDKNPRFPLVAAGMKSLC